MNKNILLDNSTTQVAKKKEKLYVNNENKNETLGYKRRPLNILLLSWQTAKPKDKPLSHTHIHTSYTQTEHFPLTTYYCSKIQIKKKKSGLCG